MIRLLPAALTPRTASTSGRASSTRLGSPTAPTPTCGRPALRPANGVASVPWRVFYRVTDSERYLPPLSSGGRGDASSDHSPHGGARAPSRRPNSSSLRSPPRHLARRPTSLNSDIEANVVLVAPTSTGQSAGTAQATGPSTGLPIPPNNVIPFDLVKTAASIVWWGDSSNNKLLGALITSALGQNVVPMSRTVLEGSTVTGRDQEPRRWSPLPRATSDPNGFVVNVATDPSITVFQDVNGNPISYFDGQEYRSLQADYVASGDGTILPWSYRAALHLRSVGPAPRGRLRPPRSSGR